VEAEVLVAGTWFKVPRAKSSACATRLAPTPRRPVRGPCFLPIPREVIARRARSQAPSNGTVTVSASQYLSSPSPMPGWTTSASVLRWDDSHSCVPAAPPASIHNDRCMPLLMALAVPDLFSHRRSLPFLALRTSKPEHLRTKFGYQFPAQDRFPRGGRRVLPG